MGKMYSKNYFGLSTINLSPHFFIFWGIFLGLLLNLNAFTFHNLILGLIIFLIPLMLISPNIGFVLFIFSLGLNSNSVSLNIGFHLQYAYLLLILAVFSWILNKMIKKEEIIFKKTAITIPLFAFLIIASISIFQSRYIPDVTLILYNSLRNYPWVKSLTRVVLLALMIALFYFVINFIENKKVLRLTMAALLLSVTLFSFIGLYAFVSAFVDLPQFPFDVRSGYSNELPRIHGFSPEPLFFGNYLMVFLPFFLLLYLSRYYILNKQVHLFSILIILTAIVLTYSRSVWAVLLFMFGLIGIVKRKEIFHFKYFKPALIFLILFLPFFSSYLVEPVQKSLILPIKGAFDVSTGKFWSTRLRITAFDLAIQSFKQHPILGIGLQNFNFHSGEVDFPGLFDYRSKWNLETINNLPLTILVELGIVGFVIGGWLFFRILKTYYLSLKKVKKDPYFYTLINGGLISFLIFMAQSFFFSTLTFPYFWFSLGITFAVINLAKENEKQTNMSELSN